MPRLEFSNEDYFNVLIIYKECENIFKIAYETLRFRFPGSATRTLGTLTRGIHHCKTHGQFVKITEK